MDFDVIPFEDIKGNWKKLGSGSFGNVYKGSYLGVDVAIKEVLPSTDYDVSKYFLRESTIMKEARHPNVVLYLGLSRAPPPDGRIFIISEFIENGNLRQYIYDKSKPFSWRLRLSFMTDMARALAYLHARKCIHRDMKGENLLVTSNGRLKVTDFGFARIAARNEEESKRLTFCGTDSYMSPEILVGEEFDLPTDVFSLGIIFCEIIARRLADDKIFKRLPPFFGIEESQVYELASPGCPPELITLALECCSTNPMQRPTMVNILARLRAIELEVLARPAEEEQHVGSIKFLSTTKRPSAAPRIPSFGMGVGRGSQLDKADDTNVIDEQADDSDDELESAVRGLEGVRIGGQETKSWRADGWKDVERSQFSEEPEAMEPLIERESDSAFAEYSTTVIRGPNSASSKASSFANNRSSISSIMTVRHEEPDPAVPPPNAPHGLHVKTGPRSAITLASYHTASTPSDMNVSFAAATEGSGFSEPSSMSPSGMSSTASALHHRFTLIKPGAKRSSMSSAINGTGPVVGAGNAAEPTPASASWSPFDFFFFSGGLVGALGTKCDLCNKRLGWKAMLECDDCGLSPDKNNQEKLTKDAHSSTPHVPDHHHHHHHSHGTRRRTRRARHERTSPPPDYDDLVHIQTPVNRSASAPPALGTDNIPPVVLVSDNHPPPISMYDDVLVPIYDDPFTDNAMASWIPFPERI